MKLEMKAIRNNFINSQSLPMFSRDQRKLCPWVIRVLSSLDSFESI